MLRMRIVRRVPAGGRPASPMHAKAGVRRGSNDAGPDQQLVNNSANAGQTQGCTFGLTRWQACMYIGNLDVLREILALDCIAK